MLVPIVPITPIPTTKVDTLVCLTRAYNCKQGIQSQVYTNTIQMKVYRFGDIVPQKGNYTIVDKNGTEYIGMDISLDEGQIFPPTEKDGQGYIKK